MDKNLELLEDFFENASDGFVSADATSNKIGVINRSLIRKLGYVSAEQFDGRGLEFIFHPSCYDLVDNLYSELKSKGEVSSKQVLVRHRDGRPIRMDLSVSGTYAPSGKLLFSRSILREKPSKNCDAVSSSEPNWTDGVSEEDLDRLAASLQELHQQCEKILELMPIENAMFLNSMMRLTFDIERALETIGT